MNCKLCGKPTGRFLHVYPQECLDRLHSELAEIDEIIALYESGEIEHRYAKARIVNATSTDYIQKFFWNNIYSRTSIRTYDHLVYSQSLIEVFEEKNHCRMERTGLSYAKYPQWECTSQKICELATIAFTDNGVYFLDGKDYYIPYSKIVDVGIKTTFSRKEVYFDVKTSSPHRHRYSARTADKKNSEFTDNAYKLLMLMTGITQISR